MASPYKLSHWSSRARIGGILSNRIGIERVEALERDDTPRKYSVDDLKAIRDHYRARLKELKAK